jgi:hypothetical protein
MQHLLSWGWCGCCQHRQLLLLVAAATRSICAQCSWCGRAACNSAELGQLHLFLASTAVTGAHAEMVLAAVE